MVTAEGRGCTAKLDGNGAERNGNDERTFLNGTDFMNFLATGCGTENPQGGPETRQAFGPWRVRPRGLVFSPPKELRAWTSEA